MILHLLVNDFDLIDLGIRNTFQPTSLGIETNWLEEFELGVTLVKLFYSPTGKGNR